MKIKWDITCECVMKVIADRNDQFRVIYLTKCSEHKTDDTVRTVWKHHVWFDTDDSDTVDNPTNCLLNGPNCNGCGGCDN